MLFATSMPSRQKEAENQNDFGGGPVNNLKEGKKKGLVGKVDNNSIKTRSNRPLPILLL